MKTAVNSKQQQFRSAIPDPSDVRFFVARYQRKDGQGNLEPGTLVIRQKTDETRVEMDFRNFPRPWLSNRFEAIHYPELGCLTVSVEQQLFTVKGSIHNDMVFGEYRHLYARLGASGEPGPFPEEWHADEDEGGGLSEVADQVVGSRSGR